MNPNIICRYNPKTRIPDNLEFSHQLTKKWFESLTLATLDYQQKLYEHMTKKPNENKEAARK